MKNKTAIAISAFLIVFIATISIGVVRTVNARNTVLPTPTSITAEFIAREQSYQQLINEANARIEQANQQISGLVSANAAAVAAAATPQSPYLFTADQAAALAANKAGTLPSSAPEVVSYSGTPAYEVIYSNGNIYIDANTGKVLYNGLYTAPTTISADQAISIASNYIGRNDVAQIASGTINGTQAYAVSFSNGAIVYIDLYGNILGVQQAPTRSNDDGGEEHDD
jgi:hypothetical protein